MKAKSKKKSRKRQIALLALGGIALALIALPFAMGTGTYPVAVVNGNSMYPNLKNGDLIFFAAPSSSIKNGTVIVLVQGGTGIPQLDSLLRPVLIHRVVGIQREPSGAVYYQTKGDNNLAPDPFVTDSSNVLGVPVVVVPYAGLPILFLQTPFGLVAISAFATLFFLSGIDSKMEDSQEKKKLIALFAQHSLNGDLSARQFERLQLAIEYYDNVNPDLLTDPTMISTIDWLRGGGLYSKWKEKTLPCPDCNSASICIESGDKSFLVCPKCCSDRRE